MKLLSAISLIFLIFVSSKQSALCEDTVTISSSLDVNSSLFAETNTTLNKEGFTIKLSGKENDIASNLRFIYGYLPFIKDNLNIVKGSFNTEGEIKNVNSKISQKYNLKINPSSGEIYGIPFSDLTSNTITLLSENKKNITLKDTQVRIFGGEIKLSKFKYDLKKNENKFTLSIQGIELAEILRHYPQENIRANGKLYGIIPFIVKDSKLYLKDGILRATEDGGYLKLINEEAKKSLTISRPELKLVFEAISDLKYSKLEANLNFEPTGELLISLKIIGKNKDLNNRPIDLNINIEENVYSLLESIKLAKGHFR